MNRISEGVVPAASGPRIATLLLFLLAIQLSAGVARSETACNYERPKPFVQLLKLDCPESTELVSELAVGDEIVDDCCCDDCCAPPWTLWYALGPTVTKVSSNEEWGFGHSLTGGYRFTDSFGVFGGIGANHIDGSTQILATAGLQKFADPCGCTVLERSVLWVFWDHFDSSPNGDDSDQIRIQGGYYYSPRLELGVAGTTNTKGQGGLIPMGGTATLFPGHDYIGGYANLWLDRADVGLMLGHTDATDGVLAGVNARVPVSRRANLGVGLAAGDDAFAANMYAEFGLGARDTRQ